MPRWKGFERLAEKIARDLAPNAEIKLDDHIRGHLSGTDRQIDVSIRWTYNEQKYLLIVDTKDWKRAADIKAIDSFAMMVKDVRASRGVLVCNSGFSANALTYAKNLGIHLYNLHDAQSRNWSRDLTIPILWVQLTPELYPQMEALLDKGDTLNAEKWLQDGLSMDGGNTSIAALRRFITLWNQGSLPRNMGVEHRLNYPARLKVRVERPEDEEAWRKVRKFSLAYRVAREAWLGQFRPTECRGLIDFLDEQAFMASYLPIDQVPIQRDESWEKIGDPERVALSLRGTVVTTESFEVLEDSGRMHRFGARLMEHVEPFDPGED